jgi:hypothetical protein
MKRQNGKAQIRIRAILGGLLFLMVASYSSPARLDGVTGVTGPTFGVSPIAFAQQSPDLCELLKKVAGTDQVHMVPGVGDPDATGQCEMDFPDKSAQMQGMSIHRWGSPDEAHSLVATDVRNSSNSWVPTTDFGDPGYGYDLPETPDPQSPQLRLAAELSYARDCYSVFGRAGYDFDTNAPHDPGPMRDMAKAVDRELQKYPCGEKPTVPSGDMDLQVDHIEVVQVTQTAANDIPLVAGKTTVVRVFIKADPFSDAARNRTYSVEASLTFKPDKGTEMSLRPSNGPIKVKPLVDPIRSSIDDSINFIIRGDQATAGPFSLKAVVNPTHAIAETDFSNNKNRDDNKRFEFVQRNGLRVGFVRVGYKPPGYAEWHWPLDTAQLTSYDSMMRKLYPVADNGIQYYEMPWRIRLTSSVASPILADDFLWTLRGFYDRIQGDKPDILVAWLPNISTAFNGAAEKAIVSGAGLMVQKPHVAMVMETLGENVPQVTLAHEVGHDLGLEHPGTTGDAACTLAPNSRLVTGYWPSEYGDNAYIQEPGFDTVLMRVLYPVSNYDLMAYCPAESTWITPFHYKKLFDGNLRPQAGNTVALLTYYTLRGLAWAQPGGGKAKIEAVRISDSGPGGGALPPYTQTPFHTTNYLGAAHPTSFMPLADLRAGNVVMGKVVQQSGTGNHCVRLLGVSGSALYEQCFDLDFLSPETEEPMEKSGFVLDVPDPGQGKVASMVLIRNDGGQEQQLASLQVSSHAPTLTITSPKAGDSWEGEHTISWSGSDQDGDSLKYDIQYSPDGKKSWYPLEIGSQDSQYTFSTEEILPSDQTYVRVIASDGFNTTRADVGPLIVPLQANSPKPPPPPSGASTPAAGITSDSSSLFIIGGGVLVVVVGVVMLLVMRRAGRKRVLTSATPVARPPRSQPVYPTGNATGNVGPVPNPFQAAEQRYWQLRSAVAAGQISQQEYQAAVRQMVVRDTRSYSWMLGEVDGLWYVYDGRSWVHADPHRQA